MSLNIEQVREVAALLAKGIESLDGITNELVQIRYNHALLTIDPSVSDGQATPTDLAQILAVRAKQKDTVVQALLSLTGGRTADDARERATTLLILVNEFAQAHGEKTRHDHKIVGGADTDDADRADSRYWNAERALAAHLDTLRVRDISSVPSAPLISLALR